MANLLNPTPKEIKKRNELWAKALEANKYKGCGRMRYKSDGNEYRCCLGVAEDVAISCGVNVKRGWLGPSSKIRDFFGWERDIPFLDKNKEKDAIYYNDVAKYPHKEIAKLVRETFC